MSTPTASAEAERPPRKPPIFLPKSLTAFHGCTGSRLARDLVAGLTVGMVALPLALAIGIASVPAEASRDAGLSPPVMGLYTAITAGFLISALGGTRACIGGPTAAFAVIVYSVAATHGYTGLVLATVMAGVILVVMGLTGLGSMIKYIPYPVTLGFTAGIGVTIFTGQVKDLMGLHALESTDKVPPEFIGKVQWYFTHVATIHWPTAALGLLCTIAIFLWPRYVTRRVPGPVVVLLAATAAAQWMKSAWGIPIETIGDRFGAIPSGLPPITLPNVEWANLPGMMRDLGGSAFTIAMLAAIESLLCAVVADGMLGTRHRSNTELIAQGTANIVAPLLGGIPATGAIARTATNIQSGGRTPLAGMVHALTLLGIVLLFGRYAALVPMSVLAAVLVVVAWNMSEVHRFRWLLNGPRSDAAVLLTTFGLTVFADLTLAVGVGLVLASMLFIKRMADVTNIGNLAGDGNDDREDAPVGASGRGVRKVPGVEVYNVQGTFFFGAAYKLRETLDSVGKPPRVLVLNLSSVIAIDATGLHALDDLRHRCQKDGTRLMLVGLHTQPMFKMSDQHLLESFGTENLMGSIDEALREAETHVAQAGHRTRGAHDSRWR